MLRSLPAAKAKAKLRAGAATPAIVDQAPVVSVVSVDTAVPASGAGARCHSSVADSSGGDGEVVCKRARTEQKDMELEGVTVETSQAYTLHKGRWAQEVREQIQHPEYWFVMEALNVSRGAYNAFFCNHAANQKRHD